MPLSFERFQGEGVFGLSSSSSSFYPDSHKIWLNNQEDKTGVREAKQEEDLGYVVGSFLPEPTSVLDALRSPSPLASHSSTTTTLSSSHGGGTTVTATAVTPGDDNKCSHQMGLDDLDGVLSASSPGQEQSILRLIMDPGSAFGVFDPGFGFGSASSCPVTDDNSNPLCSFPFQEVTNTTEALINPTTNHCLFSSNPPLSPPAKRFNSGSHHHQPVFPFSDPDPVHDPVRRQHQFQFPFQFHQQQIPSPSSSSAAVAMVPVPSPGMAGDDQSVIIEQLFNAAELIGTNGNNNNGDHTVLAQGILARLNHHLNTSNHNHKSPFQRAASHIAEALLSLIHNDSSSLITPENLILRIAAYRSFSETSPFLQFVNFTANQSILESCNDSGFDRIHIIDFDVGYGGQWSSLMQELASGGGGGRRRNRASSLKLTVFAPPPSTVSDEFELRFTEENLKTFAGEVKVPFEIELLSIELLLNPAYWPLSLRSSEKEAIAVNLPINSVVSGYLPLILRFLKQISPNVVVCSDRGCDRNDAPFPNAVIHALQYHTSLLESLDANQNQDDSSVERFWVQPSIEKLLMKRQRWIERSPPWRSLFTQCGFSPASLSQTAEAQAECLLQRNPVRGFHVEKRQSSLVMCWQRKELVTVSAWKC
ncbi:PREDICTED: scarecrow-like protein 27 [Camelina sativa]|uniref:Scarecrow-like protein 27 n=1 Tax=Camelina sativa TaxID=90675 RepID=A0ABM0YVF9_CAMSA|nr:PREDICTED: scarecrow-like protein 27 [Camelina sativa]